MDERPLISVIVPVYKVEPYLRRCLDSIVNQTYQNLEIVLVDDGSPDNCGAICDEYAARDERIRVIHKENGGVSTARNAGLAAATGDWIGWVDSDDWIEPDMYEYLLKNAQAHGADIAVCSRYEVFPNRQIAWSWESTEVLDTAGALKRLLENRTMQNFLWDKLWKRELFEGLLFPEGWNFEDIAIMYVLFERAQRVVCLPERKYYYRQRQDSIVADITLKNRLGHYLAARQRYEEMRGKWPQFVPLLMSQCAASAIGLWTVYCANPQEERKVALPWLQEVSTFYRAQGDLTRQDVGLGLAGRLVLRLVPYPKQWAFRLAQVVSKLYEVKHGRAL